LILSATYIQDKSTKALVVYIIVFLITFFFIVKWIVYNKKKAEEDGEYYFNFFTDYRLYGVLFILLIGLYTTITELIKRL
jgi:uncharacterized membrane protein